MRRFRDALESDQLALSAELTLQKETTAQQVRNQVECLRDRVDGIQVSDNPYAWVHMSAISAAALLIEQEIDPVPLLSCRDRNAMALESDLLGLQAMGVESLLLMRGHRVPENHSMQAKTVFDVTGRDLIRMATTVSEREPERPLFIGSGARVFRAGQRWKGDSLQQRIDAGAGWIQTQICFNLEILRRWIASMKRAGLDQRTRIVVTLTPLLTAQSARWIKQNLRDSRIPAKLIKRLEEAEDERSEGIEICATTLRKIAAIKEVAGVNLMTTGDTGAIAEVIQKSGLRNDK